MGFLSKMFGADKNPADAAMPYLNQIPGTIQPLYNPFIQQGQSAYNTMSPQLNQMAQDPTAFLEAMMQGYQPSRGYQLRRDEAQRAAGNSAAAGGMRGSINDITNQSRLTDALLGEDMQQWLQNLMGIQGMGMQGLGQFYNAGYGASGNLASDMSNLLGTQAQLAFQGQSQKNQNKKDMIGGIAKGIGAVAGMPFGPAGSTVGSTLMSKFI